MKVTILHDSWRPHPLAWIHRVEARAVAGELRRSGRAVNCVAYGAAAASRPPSGTLLLRLSDPVMLAAARALGDAAIPYLGPRAAVMERCYDKYAAARISAENGIDCPATALAGDAGAMPFPLVLKPRWGSDSIGVRVLRTGPVRALRGDYIVQEQVRGAELTVAVLRGRAGMPLRIHLPEGTVYSFFRKHVARPRAGPLEDEELAERARNAALRISGIFGADWAARIDLIHESATGRLRFLECDVAPLIGPRSAFAASLAAAGTGRAEQLQLLLHERAAL